MFMDSTGVPIKIGDTVRWRGGHYTISGFRPKEGRGGNCAALTFEEPFKSAEVPDEWAVDLVRD